MVEVEVFDFVEVLFLLETCEAQISILGLLEIYKQDRTHP